MFAYTAIALLRKIPDDCQVDFFAAWDVAIRSLPTDKINEIHEDGTSLLSCMLMFGREGSELGPTLDFDFHPTNILAFVLASMMERLILTFF